MSTHRVAKDLHGSCRISMKDMRPAGEWDDKGGEAPEQHDPATTGAHPGLR